MASVVAAASSRYTLAMDIREFINRDDYRTDNPAFRPYGKDDFDWSNVIERSPELNQPGGGSDEVFFPKGQYYLSRTWTIPRSLYIRGVGTGWRQSGTDFWVPPGVSPFYLPFAGADGRNASGTRFERVRILGGGYGTHWGAYALCHGIVARAPFEVDHCYVRTFNGDGVNAYGSAGGQPKSDVSLSKIVDTRIDGCARHGISIAGGDANMIKIHSCSSSDNGNFSGFGYGYYDEGFLGNSYRDCHAEFNRTGNYYSGDANSRSRYSCCYNEGSGPSEIRPPAEVVGGVHTGGLNADALYIGTHGKQVSVQPGLRAVNSLPDKERSAAYVHRIRPSMEARLGTANTPGSIFEVGEAAGGVHWRILYEYLTNFYWEWNFGMAAGGATPMRMGTNDPDPRNTDYRRGFREAVKMWLENGMFLGSPQGPAARVYVTSAKAKPSTGTWEKGDLVINAAPGSGLPAFWQCVASGSPGSWAEGPVLG